MYGKWETVWCAQPTRNLRREVSLALCSQNGGGRGSNCQISWISIHYGSKEDNVCAEREREVELCILDGSEALGRATIPADHEDGEVGRGEGGGPRKEVEAVGQQHCRFPPKTASGVKSRTYLLWGERCV